MIYGCAQFATWSDSALLRVDGQAVPTGLEHLGLGAHLCAVPRKQVFHCTSLCTDAEEAWRNNSNLQNSLVCLWILALLVLLSFVTSASCYHFDYYCYCQ